MPTKGERRTYERLKALFEPAPAPDPTPEPDGDDDGTVMVFTGRKADRFMELVASTGADLAELLPGGDDDDDQDDDDDDDEPEDVAPDPSPAPRNRFFTTRTRG